jgi:aerobic carbon-monoxide dehydrogenase medium subunit
VRYVRATTVEDAVAHLRDDPDGTKVLAGGTALVLMLRNGLVRPERLVDITAIPGLRHVETQGEWLAIGGLLPMADAARHPLISGHFPALATAFRAVGNVRIRNAGTVAGNVVEADYASDPPSVLVALGAVVDIVGPEGSRTESVEDFIRGFYTTTLGPAELVTGVRVPIVAGRRSTYLKYRSRSTEDRPCVGVAATLDLRGDGTVERCEVAIGAAAARPQRYPDLTAVLVGRRIDESAVAEVAAAYAQRIDPMEDQRGSAWYRRQMVEVHVRRALLDVAGGGQ